MKCILPCAGFGTRVGMQPNQSKEMLIEPGTNRPVIEYSLLLCNEYKMTPMVVTRADKKDLIEYCTGRADVLIVDPIGEWSMSVLMTQPYWEKNNILILPDTRFSPTSIITKIENDLNNGADISLGLHNVDDPDKWCIVQDYGLYEKPKHLPGNKWAFGIIGFTEFAGYKLFKNLEMHKVTDLHNTSFQYLESFKDITRDKKDLNL